MRRLPLLTAAVLALLVALPAAPSAKNVPGHNVPTKRLEAGFKVAQFERAGDPNGCYPSPPALAAEITLKIGEKATVAPTLKQVRKSHIHILQKGARCGHLVMALRFKRQLWILDSTKGSLAIAGRKGKRHVEKGSKGPLRSLKLVSRKYTMSTPDVPERLEVTCPSGRFPLGGGTLTSPPVSADGEGIYPHSSERLGAQRGWHDTPVLLDPGYNGVTPRKVSLQVWCGRGLVPTDSPHKTVFLTAGRTTTAVARCPKGTVLLSGGFQRTNFVSHGGSYVTESRAAGPRAWRVSGRAFGLFGGEVTAIAYCDRQKKPLLTEVRRSAGVPAGTPAQVTTPSCPKGRKLTLGGFSTDGSHQALFSGGWFNKKNGNWTASSYGYFGPSANLTAYGYCLKTKGRRP